jgi:hypothetical protein
MFKVEWTWDLKDPWSRVMPAERQSHGECGAYEMTVNDVRIDMIDQVAKLTCQAWEPMRP